MQRSRAWTGWPLFSYGFRPFFLFGALHAAIMVALWVPWFLGFVRVPSHYSPVIWHVHELLFGYVPAIVAGFLLTAVPNWTGRLPVVGWPLIGLFMLWLLGRLVTGVSALLPEFVVYAFPLVFAVAMVLVFGREIAAGRNWRNLKVVAVLCLFGLAQVLFYYETARYGHLIYADRAGVALIVMLIQIIGGRVVPSFTINWLRRRGGDVLSRPFGRFDQLVMVLSGLALTSWVLLPMYEATEGAVGIILLAAGGLNLVRQWRWHPWPTWREPLVAILHIAFLSIGVGFMLAGYATLAGDYGALTAAPHCWTVGSIGGMTLAMMTRASRGHTGHELIAPPTTVTIYVLIVVAAIARIWAALVPELTMVLMPMAGLAWVFAFAGFAMFYGPMLLKRRREAH
ncbi:MAG: NnrS family protein [Hyphomicrobiaceae bacterium]|nr:NnrS family protein [Hyphomicrobiaceae bacterium]